MKWMELINRHIWYGYYMIFISPKFISLIRIVAWVTSWWSHIRSALSLDIIDTKVIDTVLSNLGVSDEKFKSSLDKFFKLSMKIANDSEDMCDELALYNNMIFHVYLPDLDYNIWIKTSENQLNYNTNRYEVIPKNSHAIHYILNRATVTKILRQEMSAAEAYFKGLVSIDGELSDAIISRNILNLFFAYINHFMK